jgi:tripartite-type tricarboxylate transporter receptor subunit TctC
MKRRRILQLLPLAGLNLAPSFARAQTFPSRPITLLVGGAPGSGPDVMVRPIAERLSAVLGQPVVVVNKPGAAGSLAVTALMQSAPDGHTLALATMSQAVFNTYLFAKLPYDALRDLEPIAPLVTGAMVLAAHPSFPARSLAELVALAKSSPGKYFIAIPQAGSPPHIVALLLNRAAGIETTFVPHKSGSEAIHAAISGEIPLLVDGPVIISSHVQAGKLKALAVTGRQREAVLPQTPTAAESGFDAPGEAWFGLVAPTGTPAAIVQRLNREVTAVMASAEMQKTMGGLGFRTLQSTPDEFRSLIRQEHAKWGPLIRDAGLKID